MQEQVSSFIDKFSGLTEEYKFYNGEVTLRYQPEEHVYYLLKNNELIPQDGVTTIVHIIDKSNALVPWAAKMVAEKLLRTVPTYQTPSGEKLISPLTFDDFTKVVLEAKSAPRDKVEEAADVGHMAHAWIEHYIKLQLNRTTEPLVDLQDERAKSCCNAALKWMKEHNVRWIDTERKIYSRTYSYAGTMDGKALVDSCSNPNCCAKSFSNRLSVIDWKSSNYLYIEYLLQTAAYQYATEEELKEQIDDRWIIRLGKTDGEFEPWHIENRADYVNDFTAFLTALTLYRLVHQLESRMNIKKEWLKDLKKKEKEAAKVAKLAIKCKNADKYKGIKYPTCNSGNPCKTCLEKYAENHKDIDKHQNS